MRNKLIIIGLLLCLAVGLTGAVRQYGPDVSAVSGWFTAGKIERVAIIYETKSEAVPSLEWNILIAKAASAGVTPFDKDILGPGKQPSAELAPFLEAVKDKPLPALVLKMASGKFVVEPCPPTIDALKVRTGQ